MDSPLIRLLTAFRFDPNTDPLSTFSTDGTTTITRPKEHCVDISHWTGTLYVLNYLFFCFSCVFSRKKTQSPCFPFYCSKILKHGTGSGSFRPIAISAHEHFSVTTSCHTILPSDESTQYYEFSRNVGASLYITSKYGVSIIDSIPHCLTE